MDTVPNMPIIKTRTREGCEVYTTVINGGIVIELKGPQVTLELEESKGKTWETGNYKIIKGWK